MKNTDSKSMPKYQLIALEIANRIAGGELCEGELVFGRSSIAGSFHVSPETARRAFCMLADMGIVSPERGAGMLIVSKKNAELFAEQFRERQDIASLRDSVLASIMHQKQEMEKLSLELDKLISATELYRSSNLLSPYMLLITEKCRFLGKTIKEINLWQFTGATLVAIRRDGQMLLSPGPYACLQLHDILFFVTGDLSDVHVREFLEGAKPE